MLFFLILILMPVDSFTVGADLLREFGARPVNFILAFLFSAFLLKRIGFNKGKKTTFGGGGKAKNRLLSYFFLHLYNISKHN